MGFKNLNYLKSIILLFYGSHKQKVYRLPYRTEEDYNELTGRETNEGLSGNPNKAVSITEEYKEEREQKEI